MCESLRTSLSEIVFSCRVLSQAREATVAEVNGFIDGPLATALAEARAEGRRQGLEEAAIAAEFHAGVAEVALKAPAGTAETDSIHRVTVAALVQHILSLATNTPVTQKPETGESALAALEGGEHA